MKYERLYEVVEWCGTPHASRPAAVATYMAKSRNHAIRKHWATRRPGALLVTAAPAAAATPVVRDRDQLGLSGLDFARANAAPSSRAAANATRETPVATADTPACADRMPAKAPHTTPTPSPAIPAANTWSTRT